jgi:hypothetical protein
LGQPFLKGYNINFNTMPQFKSFEDFVLFMEDYEIPSQTPSTICLNFSHNETSNKNISLNDISQCHTEKS